MQRVGHLRDHLKADERRQYQDCDLGDRAHAGAPCPAAWRAPSCTISPPRVMHAPAITSSSKSSVSVPSSEIIKPSSDSMLRAYSCEACSAIVLGTFSGARIFTT